MPTLVLYHDFTSPFCRIALETAAHLAGDLGLALRAAPFELRPAPDPLPPPRDTTIGQEIAAAAELAAAAGVTLAPPSRVPRTRKAHEAVAYARARGRQLEILRALYAALWERDADIGRIDVIADLAPAAGLEAEPLHVALGVNEHQAEVEDEERRAETDGIDGVPAFRLGDRVLVGLVSAEELRAWVEG